MVIYSNTNSPQVSTHLMNNSVNISEIYPATIIITLLGRGFFVFFPLMRMKKKPLPGLVYHSSEFVIIQKKISTEDHLALDGVSSHVHDRKTNTTWHKFLFSFSSEGNSKKPLPSRVIIIVAG